MTNNGRVCTLSHGSVYLKYLQNPENLAVIQDLIKKQDGDALSKLLETRLQFGTAGLRGKMGAGFNAMNDLVIIQTTQGFAKYLETVFSEDQLARKGIVIGYDARHNSQRLDLCYA